LEKEETYIQYCIYILGYPGGDFALCSERNHPWVSEDVVYRSLKKVTNIKLMKGKALRKHSLHEKTAASVLLKLFISGNE